MSKLIPSLGKGVPRPLTELIPLGRTLKKRAADVLAYFDRPRTSNGPTEALNGRLEHLRGSALGFLNLTNYKRRGEHVAISWDAGTVTLTDAQGHAIATYEKPATRHGWHGPTQNRPSTNS